MGLVSPLYSSQKSYYKTEESSARDLVPKDPRGKSWGPNGEITVTASVIQAEGV